MPGVKTPRAALVPEGSPSVPTACVCPWCTPGVQPEGSLELLGVNTKGILARAAVRSVPTFRIAMGEHDEENQVGAPRLGLWLLCSVLGIVMREQDEGKQGPAQAWVSSFPALSSGVLRGNRMRRSKGAVAGGGPVQVLWLGRWRLPATELVSPLSLSLPVPLALFPFPLSRGPLLGPVQAEVLPEAVRVLASLLSTGHRVHISCLRGLTCGPLVVLG